MRVTHSGSFSTLPLKDKARIVVAFPFVMVGAAALAAYNAIGDLFSHGARP